MRRKEPIWPTLNALINPPILFAKPHVNNNASNFDAAKCFSISNDMTFLKKIQCNGRIDLCCLRKSYYGGLNFCCHVKEECAVWDIISILDFRLQFCSVM